MQHIHTRTHPALIQWNYRLVVLPLFWVNTFTGYLGNAVNEPSIERLAVLAALDTLFSIHLFLALMLGCVYFSSSSSHSLSPQFWSFYLYEHHLVHEMRSNKVQLKYPIQCKTHGRIIIPVDSGAAKEYTVEYKCGVVYLKGSIAACQKTVGMWYLISDLFRVCLLCWIFKTTIAVSLSHVWKSTH